MKLKGLIVFFLVIGLSLFWTSTQLKGEHGSYRLEGDVLILFDSYGQWGWLGQIYAIFLYNLLGHFNLKVEIEPVEGYQQGELEQFSTIFYLGNVYNNFLPVSFLDDVYNTERTVVWFRYNLWQLRDLYDFQSRYGFQFHYMVELNADPSPEYPNPGFYDTIYYKEEVFHKYYRYDPEDDTWAADPYFGLTSITDPSISTAYVMAENSGDGTQAPYALKGANLWYIADIPFSYLHEEDRYIPFCDLLHDILGIDHPESHRAVIRLEDVDPELNPDWIYTITDALYERQVPFAIATIPVFKDPLAYYYDEPVEYHLKDFPEMVAALHYAEEHGASIILHGYTHQYDSRPNPYNGVSGDDFEFWDALNGSPLPEDSDQWVRGRLKTGILELERYDIYPDAFEAPHYMASELDYKLFGNLFVNTVQRTGYFVHPAYYSKEVNPKFFLSIYPQHFGGQFFPYVIVKDFYGQRITPENLGCLVPEAFVWEGAMPRSSDDILRAAEKELVVRDGWASFFFHPFYLEYGEYYYPYGSLQSMIDIVEGLKELGYQFVDLKEDLPPISVPAERLLVGNGENGGSEVKICDMLGRVRFSKVVFGAGNPSGEVHVAAGDVNEDGSMEILVGEGEGGSSWVKVFTLAEGELFKHKVFGAGNSKGEVNVASGDVDGDGFDEIICGHGDGGVSWVKVYELNGSVIFSRRVFGGGNTHGEVHVASGDVDGDGFDEIICGHGDGGSSWVNVYELNGSVIFSGRVFGTGNTHGEVHVASGDVDGDGVDEIVCGHGYGGSSWVKIYELNKLIIFNQRLFSEDNPSGEVNVAAGKFPLS